MEGRARIRLSPPYQIEAITESDEVYPIVHAIINFFFAKIPGNSWARNKTHSNTPVIFRHITL